MKTKTEPVANLYAKALFELSVEKNLLDQVAQELESLHNFLCDQKELERALADITFSIKERTQLASEFAKTLSFSPLVSHFFVMVVSKNRLDSFGSIFTAFRLLLDEKKNIVRGTVVTVSPLSEKEKNDLADAFEKKLNKKVLLESLIDKEILGGLIVNIKGQTFDGSLKTSIRRLKENLERQSV